MQSPIGVGSFHRIIDLNPLLFSLILFLLILNLIYLRDYSPSTRMSSLMLNAEVFSYSMLLLGLEMSGLRLVQLPKIQVCHWWNSVKSGSVGAGFNCISFARHCHRLGLKHSVKTNFVTLAMTLHMHDWMFSFEISRTVPCTSRKPRPGEINGVDYTFLSIEQFRALEAKGELLESGRYNRATTREHRYKSDSASEHEIDWDIMN